MNSLPRAYVYQEEPSDVYRAGRSLRSLEAAGIRGVEMASVSGDALQPILAEGESVLFLRAGAWLANSRQFRIPPASATGRPLCAAGAVRIQEEQTTATSSHAAGVTPNQPQGDWSELFAETGGDFSRTSRAIPAVAFYLDGLAVRRLSEKGVGSLDEVFRLAAAEFRFVHYSPLDVFDDRSLHVVQVITSLQRGGAERMTLDLMEELPVMNTRARLVTLGRAAREAFSAPAGTCELAETSRNAETRRAELRRLAIEFGTDLVHGHLLSRADARAISAAGLPLVLTVHNTRPGWPAGLGELTEKDAALLVACARSVGADLRQAGVPLPIRTVRNGIALAEFRKTPERAAAGKRWRGNWGFGADDFVLMAVANPRPQKRLHLLPAVLAALRAKLTGRHDGGRMAAIRPPHEPACALTGEVPPHPGPLPRGRENSRQRLLTSAEMVPAREARLVFVGEVLRGNPDAERCLAETRAETERLGLAAHVRWTGSISDVAEILAAGDVLVSTSAHEGLSLAQLEALAMGCAVVATDVGGAGEIAEGARGFYLVSPDASAEEFGEVLARVAGGRGGAQNEEEEDDEARAGLKANFATSEHGENLAPSPRPSAACELSKCGTSGPLSPTLSPSEGEREKTRAGAAECLNSMAVPRPSALRKGRGESVGGLNANRTQEPVRNGDSQLSLDWSRGRMAARYRWLYPRAIAAARRAGRGSGLWLITNNFSTGGAQSSARRLLLGLQAAGERVRAAVVEEDPEWPTAGRRALVEAKIPVIAPGLNAAGVHEAAIEQILGAVDADPPQSVLFWNLRPAFKVALADALAGVPIYDISPGEMFYDSLEKYFTKPQWKFGCRTPLEYGGLLAGVIVKYSAEAEQAEQFLGAPVHVIPNGVEVVKRNGAGREAEEARPHPSPLPQGEGETSAVPGRMDDSGPRESRCERGQISESPFVFGTAARINPQKRLEDLLEAFHLAHDRLPPYVLKIAGGEETGCGEYAAKLRAGCNGLPVQWLGEVTDVAGFHRGLDAFAMISEPAGCPNASLEAMAAGLPIIATDFGGASEQVIDGETGRLVPARDSRALALALIETATRSELFRKMGMAGKQLMKERFSLERMIEGYRRVCLGGMR